MEKWKRGAGDFIAFAISMIGFCSFIIFFIGFFMYARSTLAMENAANIVSRDVVTCESLDDANEVAQEDAETLLEGYVGIENIVATVYYTPGSDTEWVKGNFVTVVITADMTFNVPLISSNKQVSNVVMIERSE